MRVGVWPVLFKTSLLGLDFCYVYTNKNIPYILYYLGDFFPSIQNTRIKQRSGVESGQIQMKPSELSYGKTNQMACAPSEDTDQPGHLWMPSLI